MLCQKTPLWWFAQYLRDMAMVHFVILGMYAIVCGLMIASSETARDYLKEIYSRIVRNRHEA